MGLSPEMMQMISTAWPFVFMGLIFYFLLYRPQKKEQQKRSELLNSLKKGDHIITIGGIYGTITALTEKTVTIKIAEKVDIEISRSAVGHFQKSEPAK